MNSTGGLSVGIGARKNVVTTNSYKVANALSEEFSFDSYRSVASSWALYSKGCLTDQRIEEDKNLEPDGIMVKFTLDKELFPNSYYRLEIVKDILEQYSAKHKGFPISLNGY